MKPILLLFLFALLKRVNDTLKVPQVFNSTIFARWKGVKWIDPLITGPESKFFLIRPFTSMFRDLWHTINTIIIFGFIHVLYIAYGHTSYLNWWQFQIGMWLIYGYCFEWFGATLKWFAPESKNKLYTLIKSIMKRPDPPIEPPVDPGDPEPPKPKNK